MVRAWLSSMTTSTKIRRACTFIRPSARNVMLTQSCYLAKALAGLWMNTTRVADRAYLEELEFINRSAFSMAEELAAKITFLPATIAITPRLFSGIHEVFHP